jgi:2-hydroxy-3-keto-5-methylthiopentenyl-1-phosphate phosphatase
VVKYALVSDFDGTITATDFYLLIAERYIPAEAPDFFAMYRAGELRHWEAMQGFFQYAPTDDAALADLMRDTGVDPDFAGSVERLSRAGWDLIIVSAGSSWYIDRILNAVGVQATVHAIPGEIVAGRGLQLSVTEESPFFSSEVGVDKPSVVQGALQRYERVAFAGDGPPDLAPALLVAPEMRFARGYLAEELKRRGEGFNHFSRWSDVANALLQR